MLSKEEWKATAERAAAAKHGERNADWLYFKRFHAGPVGALVIVGLIGLGLRWVYVHLAEPLLSGAGPEVSGHLPATFWWLAALWLIGTLVAFRLTPSVPSLLFLIIRLLLTVAAGLALLSYAIVVLLA